MSSGFDELTDQAHHLVSAGDIAGAQRLLSDALTDADPRPANATPELAEAASLQARVLVALGEPHSARGWAAFAYAATTRLHGRSDPRTVAAAATLAAVLHRVGSHSRAARLYQDVIIELTAQDGPESLRVLAAHADLATVEYARGQCTVARDRLQDAWELHREVYGDGHPSGIKMLARLGSMQRDCGQFAEAHDNLALARELCRQHLSTDDPLALQVAALARAAANPDHVCADDTSAVRDAPVVPAARTPPPQPDPPLDAAYYPPAPQAAAPAGRTDEGLAGSGVSSGGPVPNPRVPADEPDGSPDFRWPPADEPEGSSEVRWPPTDEPNFRWPPDPADDPVPQPTAAPVPPSVAGFTGGTEESSGVYRLYRPGASAEPDRPSASLTPYTPSRLLPVPVHRAPAAARNKLVPVLVAGVVVVLLGTAAVIAGVARVGDDPKSGPAPSAGPSGTAAPPTTGAPTTGTTAPAAVPGTPPGTVSLRDNRDNIALRWTYPAGGEGPVIVSAGRAGQEKTAIATLPAGTDSYIVYALNRANDYCFTVAVVWSTDTVASANQVCTRRR
ncbi:tetratricopeptide repeat protein [Micromonospora sp. NPDC049801]|uniref:tetratricopeptide repeat protein n=1 Tax=unclassified Micromonospora TaxID=2617518 RepID=UPI00340D92D0